MTRSKFSSRVDTWSLEAGWPLLLGATGGLGAAIAAELRERRAEVHGVDLAGEDVFLADLSTARGNEEMISHVLEVAGRLDILVLNAGSQFVADLREFPKLSGNACDPCCSTGRSSP